MIISSYKKLRVCRDENRRSNRLQYGKTLHKCPISSFADFYQEEECESPKALFDFREYDFSNYENYDFYSSSSSYTMEKFSDESNYSYSYRYTSRKLTKLS